MDFLIDYLPAIQFAAALNIGYIIPDVMEKMNSVLNNINNGYLNVLQDVRSRVILKSDEVGRIGVLETKDNRTSRGYVNNLLSKLKSVKDGCDRKEESLTAAINGFVKCKGYRSVFFYSALFSVLALIIIPYCHQHNDVWAFRMFFYTLNCISILYLAILFLIVICSRSDMSCRKVFGLFMLFIVISAVAAYVNELLPSMIYISNNAETLMSGLALAVPFLPGVGCMLFLMVLVFYAEAVAHAYSLGARIQFWRINRAMKKLDVINEVLEEEVTVE